MHIEFYLHDHVTEVPEEEPLTDVVNDTDVMLETDVVPGAPERSIRNAFDLFSDQFEEDARRSLVLTIICCINWFKLIGCFVINTYSLFV